VKLRGILGAVMHQAQLQMASGAVKASGGQGQAASWVRPIRLTTKGAIWGGIDAQTGFRQAKACGFQAQGNVRHAGQPQASGQYRPFKHNYQYLRCCSACSSRRRNACSTGYKRLLPMARGIGHISFMSPGPPEVPVARAIQ